jgi:thymidylate synthase
VNTNRAYCQLLLKLQAQGDYVVTRGAGVKSLFGYNFGKVRSPIITFRKTAWKTALKELELFMSGEDKCPDGVLSDVWWKDQLSPDNELRQGYPAQLRRSHNSEGLFDQVAWLREEIKHHPSSRRLCLTVWSPGVMASITDINQNPMTPSSCHLIFNQFQVRNGELRMNAVFRSTDSVLGLTHNLVQHRALQLYFAHHAGVKAAPYYDLYLNDVHYYDHPDHISFVEWINANISNIDDFDVDLSYSPTSLEFKAEDFTINIKLPEPLYTGKIARTL